MSVYDEGSVVACKIKGWTAYFRGKVDHVNADGSYKVIFDDGDVVEAVRPEEIRPPNDTSTTVIASTSQHQNTPNTHTLTVGRRVVCKLGDWGCYYPGTIQGHSPQNTYQISFDDGDAADKVTLDQISFPEELYREGACIHCKVNGSEEYLPARIVNCGEDYTYKVRLDNGQTAANILLRDIIKREDTSILKEPAPTHSFQPNDTIILLNDGSRATVVSIVSDQKFSVRRDEVDTEEEACLEELKLAAEHSFQAEDRVTCKIPVWDQFYPGRIDSITEQGLYNLTFDDGESVQQVHPSFIKAAAIEDTRTGGRTGRFHVSDRVLAKLEGWDRTYAGTVKAVDGQARYDILFDDGEFCAGVDETLIHTGRPVPLAKGSRVLATIPGWKQHYPGKIECVNLNGTYDILFDDGDTQNVQHSDVFPEKSDDLPCESVETATTKPKPLEASEEASPADMSQTDTEDPCIQEQQQIPPLPGKEVARDLGAEQHAKEEQRDTSSENKPQAVPISSFATPSGDENLPNEVLTTSAVGAVTASSGSDTQRLSQLQSSAKKSKEARKAQRCADLNTVAAVLKQRMRRSTSQTAEDRQARSLLSSNPLGLSEQDLALVLAKILDKQERSTLELKLRAIARRPQSLRKSFAKHCPSQQEPPLVNAKQLIGIVQDGCKVSLTPEEAALIIKLHKKDASDKINSAEFVRFVLPQFGLHVMTPFGKMFMLCDPTTTVKNFKAQIMLRSHGLSENGRLKTFDLAKYFGHVLIKPPAYNSSMLLYETFYDRDIVCVLTDTHSKKFRYTRLLGDSNKLSSRLSSKLLEKQSVDTKRLRKMFDRIDLNGDGVIQLVEMKKALKEQPRVRNVLLGSQKLKALTQDVERLFTEIDRNGDGLVSFEELVAALLPQEAKATKASAQSAPQVKRKPPSARIIRSFNSTTSVDEEDRPFEEQIPLQGLSRDAIDRIKSCKGVPIDLRNNGSAYGYSSVSRVDVEDADPQQTQQWVNSRSGKRWLGLDNKSTSCKVAFKEQPLYSEDPALRQLPSNPYTWSTNQVRNWLQYKVELPEYAIEQLNKVAMGAFLSCISDQDLTNIGFSTVSSDSPAIMLHRKKLLVHLEEIRKARRQERELQMEEWRMADVMDWLSRDL